MRCMNIVGARVKEARYQHSPRITQEDLAARLEVRGMNIDRGGVAKIENGHRRVLDSEVVLLAEALNVTVSWLLLGDETNYHPPHLPKSQR